MDSQCCPRRMSYQDYNGNTFNVFFGVLSSVLFIRVIFTMYSFVLYIYLHVEVLPKLIDRETKRENKKRRLKTRHCK